MNVFVAGIHAVGKSYLCEKYAVNFNVFYESSSELIKRELSHPDWTVDKKVNNIGKNQAVLETAVNRICKKGEPLLLDGHFVLINARSEFVPIASSTFSNLNLVGVVLLEASSEVIMSRLKNRDSSKSAVNIEAFLEEERYQAKIVCEELNIPLHILHTPEYNEFSDVITSLLASK